jgi:hypothetical protein
MAEVISSHNLRAGARLSPAVAPFLRGLGSTFSTSKFRWWVNPTHAITARELGFYVGDDHQ